MKGSVWILSVLLLIHLPSSIQSAALGIYNSSVSSSRRLILPQESSQAVASSASSSDCSNGGSDSCVAVRTNILPYSRTLTIAVVVIFGACIVMGFLSAYVRRFCIRDENLNVNYERMKIMQEVVGSLPIVQYAGGISKGGAAAEEGTARRECAVCLSEFEEGEALKLLPACAHLFHKACIDMWLFSHTTCPLCRLSLLPKPNRASANIPLPRVPSHAHDLHPMLAPPAATSSA